MMLFAETNAKLIQPLFCRNSQRVDNHYPYVAHLLPSNLFHGILAGARAGRPLGYGNPG